MPLDSLPSNNDLRLESNERLQSSIPNFCLCRAHLTQPPGLWRVGEGLFRREGLVGNSFYKLIKVA